MRRFLCRIFGHRLRDIAAYFLGRSGLFGFCSRCSEWIEYKDFRAGN